MGTESEDFMKTLEQIIEDLKTIKDETDIYNEIVAAFGDYEYEEESEVIVSSPDEMNAFRPKTGTHSVYINHADSPIIKFELEEIDDETFTVTDAWID